MLKFDTPRITRMAPSPTGKAHIGFTRTLYLNWLAARSTGGQFILRIDDTDKERSKQEYTDDLLATVEWLGLDYDAIFYQSQRYERYQEYAEILINQKLAERCADGAVRLRPKALRHEWHDLIAGPVAINGNQHEAIQELVIMRSDDTPTYHFASCVDDALMGVNFIIRGTDHMTNAGKHTHIWEALGFDVPLMAHAGLIFHNGKKISKRDGLASMDYYKERYCPEAVLNAVLKLGWSHPDPQFDKQYPLVDNATAVKLFPEGHLKAAKSTLDIAKLDWLNKKYAQKLSVAVGR